MLTTFDDADFVKNDEVKLVKQMMKSGRWEDHFLPAMRSLSLESLLEKIELIRTRQPLIMSQLTLTSFIVETFIMRDDKKIIAI